MALRAVTHMGPTRRVRQSRWALMTVPSQEWVPALVALIHLVEVVVTIKSSQKKKTGRRGPGSTRRPVLVPRQSSAGEP